jgi:flagellar motor protein MotB
VAVALIAAVFILAIAKFSGVEPGSHQRKRSASRVDRTHPVLQPNEAKMAAAPGLPSIVDDMPGIRWHKLESGYLITFDRDLFVHGTDFSDAAQPLLLIVAERLRPHSGAISATVLGCTDAKWLRADSPFADNFSLGLARAVTIVEFLRTPGHLPGAIFTARCQVDPLTVQGFEYAAQSLKRRTAVVKVTFDRQQGD